MNCPRFVLAPQIEAFLGLSQSFVPCPQVLSPVPSFVPCPQFCPHIVGTKRGTIHHENTVPYDNFAMYDSSGIQDITISLTQWINIQIGFPREYRSQILDRELIMLEFFWYIHK
jgi:hypothetical protein